MPNIASVQRRSVSCDKNRTGWDAVFLCIRQQLFSEFPREKNRPDFALAANYDLAARYCLDGEIPQLRYPNTGAADGFHDKPELRTALRRLKQPEIFRFCQFLFFRAVRLMLRLQVLYLTIRPAKKIKQTVQACQHGINGTNRIPFFNQLILICNHHFF